MRKAISQRIWQAVGHLWRAVRLVWESSRGWTTAALSLALMQGIAPVAVLAATGALIDAITRLVTDDMQSADALVAPLLIFGAVMFINAILGALSAYASEGQTLSVADYIQNAIHVKSVEVGLEYYENSAYYDHLHRTQQTAPYRPAQIVATLLVTLRDGMTLLGILGLLVSLNVWSPLVLFISAAPMVYLRLRFAQILYEWEKRNAETQRRIFYLSVLLTYERHAKEIRLFDLGGELIARFKAARAYLRQERLALVRRQVRLEILTQALMVAALFTALYLIIQDALKAALSIGGLVIAVQAFQRGQSLFQSLMSSISSLYEHSLFMHDFYAFLALEGQTLALPAAGRLVPQPMTEGIVFKDVAFRYAQSPREVLTGINLTIQPGEIIALVGENGAGKTTLIKLLCRLYDPTRGQITLDGVDLRAYDLASLRRAITVLFQDYSQYQLAAWENIWFGDVSAPTDRTRIAAAAQKAGADALINALPEGYDSILGNMFGGHELSVGQWQRIALARTFMRDAQLVVLDEPTSALDVMTESEVFERFRQIIQGRAAILISHRLSTIRMADKIYVLDNGCIAESGTHDQLMALDGIYAKLFRTQSRYYR